MTVFCLFFFLASGCSMQFGQGPDPEIVKGRIQQTQNKLETIKRLYAENTFPRDLRDALELFDQTKTMYANGNIKEAENNLQKVTSKIERIQWDYYCNTIARMAKEAKEALVAVKKKDADHPLVERIPELDRVIEDASSYQKEPEHLVSLEKVLDDLDEVMEILANINTSLTRIVESDIYFDKGMYILSSSGRDKLFQFVDDTAETLSAFLHIHRQEKPVIRVRVIGHTDELDFSEDSGVLEELTQGVEYHLPEEEMERKRFLNKRLSLFRAKHIAGAIEEYLKKVFSGTPDVQIQAEAVGRGEEIPANLSPPFPISDPRRRICKIYIYASMKEPLKNKQDKDNS